ncbi:MAG: glycosyl hydrolase family 98 [Prevotella sp.]|nr:glycosyl hydrolase family 98 [Prevotella sp.]
MKRLVTILLLALVVLQNASAQQRRPIDNEHPLWMVHIDVWFDADPQKVIDLIPEDIRPYVCMNLSLSCSYNKEKNIYTKPRSAVRTYKSWGSVCQKNGMWFTCQPASGGHTHIQDDDLVTFEYFFKRYPNFLGWNYAEQFWGFGEPGDKSSSTTASRWALFAKLVEMSHKYGGFLTVSFCGNIWSHPLNPIGEMKNEPRLLEACKKYPESILWLYKYTTASCFYNNESVTIAPFISGLAKNYGVRYDYCGWEGAMSDLMGEGKCKYPGAAGIGTVMEQTGINGGAVWDAPELTWKNGNNYGEGFYETSQKTVDTYSRRNWTASPHMKAIWMDMFRKIIDGTLRIPTRKEVVDRTKVVVVNDMSTGSDEDKYATWADLYDGIYKQDDPMNTAYYNGGYYQAYNGQFMANYCYFKKTGRYATIPLTLELYDDLAKSIPVQVQKSKRNQQWSTIQQKVDEFNAQYPEISKGDLFVARMGNQLVTYTPYSYLNGKTTAEGRIPLNYNTCDSIILNYGKLSSGVIREYNDHIDLYLNNFRTDTTTLVKDIITIKGATAEPTYTKQNRESATSVVTKDWDAEHGIFTLTVSHKGAIDVTIQCGGNNSRPATEATSPLPIPQQPAESHLPIVIEAENMDYKGISGIYTTSNGRVTDDMNEFAALGYMALNGTNTKASLRHQLELKQAGDYIIAVRYCNTTTAGKMEAVVNGETKTFDIEKAEKNDWQKATFTAHLNEGVNDLRLNNVNAISMFVDQIIYTPADAEPEKYLVVVYDAPLGKVTSDVSEAVEGQTVTLTVEHEEGCALKELRVVNGVYYTMEKTIEVTPDATKITFQMFDDNVVIQPVFEDISNYKLDFTSVGALRIPPGWRCVQEGNVVHEYPTMYSKGARTINGLNGFQGKALYWLDNCAEYGRQAAYPLTLEPGTYKLAFNMAAWKGTPNYKASILNAAGSTIASTDALTAAPNANEDKTTDLSSAERHELTFTVTEAGNYIISFTGENGGTGDFLLLACQVYGVDPTGITLMNEDGTQSAVIYDLSGRRHEGLVRGLNIIRTADGKTKKVYVK